MKDKKDRETEIAVTIADRYIGIHECEDGYDYTIYGLDYKEIDGGVYDNPNIAIRDALKDIIDDLREPHYDASRDIYFRTLVQGQVTSESKVTEIDYDELLEKTEMVDAKKYGE